MDFSTSRRRLFVSLVRAAGLAGLFASATLTLSAQQIPGPNINMIRGTKVVTDPVTGSQAFVGDPYLQRQNEPSIAVSTRNPCTLLAGNNDYRTVDIPDPVPLPGDITAVAAAPAKDAWLGWTKSFDCGATWRTGLIPGYPQDLSPEGLQSGLKGFGAGADPIVRAGTNGMFFFGGMVFNRDAMGGSKIFVTRWIDDNNTERGDDIRYLGTSTIDVGGNGQFLDKPWMIVDIPRNGFGPKAEPWVTSDTEAHVNAEDAPLPKGVSYCVIPAAPGIPEQRFAAGHVYMAWARFTGNSTTSVPAKLMVARSTDCGQTWQTKPISNNQHTSQGATLAIAPHDGTVYIAWREFDRQKGIHAIWMSRSRDGGDSWEKPRAVATGINPFDQPKSPTVFRTNALPTIAADHMGRVYVAWAERGFAPLNPSITTGDARIVITVSKNGGQTWSQRYPVVARNYAGAHEVMPALTFTAGKLQLLFYDFWDDKGLTPTKFVDDATAPCIATDSTGQCTARRRHTVDVAAAQAEPADAPIFKDFSVTPDGATPKISEYKSIVDETGKLVGTQTNPPNLPLYNLGSTPFIGDYIDVTGLTAIPVRQNGVDVWQPNLGSIEFTGGSVLAGTAAGTSITDFPFQPVYHAAWTDHRDVKPPPPGLTWADYVPPGQGGAGVCVPELLGMRNANVYTSRLTNGLYVGSPGNSKPLGFITLEGTTDPQHIQRAFVVFLQNTTRQEKRFLVKIANQPGTAFGDRASFLQHPRPPYVAGTALPPPQVWRVVTVPPISSVARSVYVTAAEPNAQVRITVAEIQEPLTFPPAPPAPPANELEGFLGDAEPVLKAGGLRSAVLLNPDSTNPPALDPDSDGPIPQILGPEDHEAVIFAPKATAIGNVLNTQYEIPDPQSPDEGNKAEETPDEGNPDEGNPDEGNPDEGNPDEGNAGLLNIAEGETVPAMNITDIQWKVSNGGNTTSAYKFRPTFDAQEGQFFQLFVTTRYYTPTIDPETCEVVVVRRNQVIVNVSNYQPRSPDEGNPDEGNPDEGNPDEGNPDEGNAPEADGTFMLESGRTATVTLRVYSPGPTPLTAEQLEVVEETTPAVLSPISIDTGKDEIVEAFSGPELIVKPGTAQLSASSGSPGGQVDVSWTLKNTGTTATTAPSFNNRFYLSTDQTLDEGDFEMFPRGEAVVGTTFTGILEADDLGTPAIEGERALVHELRVPRNAPPGDYFVIIYVDANRHQVEADDDNNTAVAGAFTTRFRLTFVQQPSSTTEDFSIAPPVTVAILDGDDQPVPPTDVPTITMSLSSNPAAGTLSGTLVQPNVGGTATFNNLSINNVGNGYALRAQAGALAGEIFSAPFNVEADDPPAAANDSYQIDEDGTIDTGGDDIFQSPVNNDTDEIKNGPGTPPAGRELDAVVVDAPLHAAAFNLAADGNFTYTPTANYVGPDSFTYRLNDGTANSNVATVNITVTEVNDAPVAVDDANSVPMDAVLSFPAADLLTNDSKGPADESGQTLTVTAVAKATNGTVALAGGVVTFTPTPGFFGTAGFDYTVADNGTTNGAPDPKSDVGRVNVTVVPRPPDFFGDTIDATGDAGGAGNPDLVSAMVAIRGSNVTLSVRFAPGTFVPTTNVQFALDTDKNAATGNQGSDSGCVNDAGVIGVEYIVDMGSTFGNQARIMTHLGACNSYGGTTLTGTVISTADGMDVSFPLALLGGDDGRLNFKVLSYRELGGGAFTGVLDRMTDVGQPPGKVPNEWSGGLTDALGDVGAEADLVAATITINGPNATLSARFAPGTFSASTTLVQFSLDTDKNPATGHQGTNAACTTDNGVIGTDFLVDVGSDFYADQARVVASAGTCNSFNFVGQVGGVTYVADGVDVTIPLSMLGNDDGRLNFKVTTSRYTGGAGFTGILDRATEPGQPVATVP